MRRTTVFFVCLSIASHGRRVHTREKQTAMKPDATTEGAPCEPLIAYAIDLVASRTSAAFNPSSFGIQSPVLKLARGASHPVLMSEDGDAPADEMSEKRRDATDGGIFTKAEFMEFYKDRFEEEWAKATPPGDIKAISELKVGMEVKATVNNVAPFGAFCDIGAEVDALLHKSQISHDFISNIDEKLLPGDEYKAWIQSIDINNRRVGITLKRSTKQIEELKVGEALEATVRRIVDFGAFCDIGLADDALLHKSEMSNQFVADPRDVVAEGQKLTVQIKEIDRPFRKVSITARVEGGTPPPVDPNAIPLDQLEVGQDVQGAVVSVLNFGVMVNIGAQRAALLHKSQMSEEFGENSSDSLAVGDTITARISEVDLRTQRVAITCRTNDRGNRPLEEQMY